MTFTISGKTVRTGKGKEAKLPFPVWRSIEVGDLLVVVLDVPVSKDCPRNVLAIDGEGRTVWQVPKVESAIARSCFVGVAREGELVRVFNFDGMSYDLDPADGHIVGSRFLK